MSIDLNHTSHSIKNRSGFVEIARRGKSVKAAASDSLQQDFSVWASMVFLVGLIVFLVLR